MLVESKEQRTKTGKLLDPICPEAGGKNQPSLLDIKMHVPGIFQHIQRATIHNTENWHTLQTNSVQ
jgi:hypothetical protein